MKNLYLLFILSFLASCTTTKIQQSTEVKSFSSENKSVDNSDQLLRLDQFINDHVKKGVIPGGVFYVAHKGKVIYHKAFGEKETNTPYRETDIFRIASMTKAITSVAIMQLYERGKLRLDDPIEKYIPAFANPKVLQDFNPIDSSYTTRAASKSISIRHLLTHTSGIYYGLFEKDARQAVYMKLGLGQVGLSTPGLSTLDMANLIAKAPLGHDPGSQWTYGLNMDVLGAIVEVISGKDLQTYFMENIFKPIGMDDTYFYLPETKVENLVPLYTFTEEGKLKISEDENWSFPAIQDESSAFAGGGGLSSTAEDYGKFVQMLLDNGKANGKRIIGSHTLDLMTTDQIGHLNMQGKGMSPIPGITFCLGHLYINENGEGIGPHNPGSYSWGGYFNSKWWVDPESELVFVGMTNVLPFPYGDFWDRMYPIIYSSLD